MTEQTRWTPSQASLNATDLTGETGIAFAGFWRRFSAAVIDWLLLWAALSVLTLAAGLAFGARGGTIGVAPVASGLISIGCWVLIPWLYFAVMESSSQQATLGKLAVGVKVIDFAGGRIGFGRATGRYWGKLISNTILYIGYLLAAFTARKQALHDMMAGTLVAYRNPSPERVAASVTAQPMAWWAITLIILACFVPVLGILAGISIPAYRTYTLRAQVSEGLSLADGLKARVDEKLAGTQSPIAGTLATMSVDPVSNKYVSSLVLQSGAIVITFGNQADARLAGETVAIVPERDEQGRVWWVCGRKPVHEAFEQGAVSPASLTTLPVQYLPVACRP